MNEPQHRSDDTGWDARLVLSPSLMCARLGHLEAEVERLERAGVGSMHFDVMDGHFVPNLGLSADTVRAVRETSQLPFHVHAMVEDPHRYTDMFARAGADLFIFHLEAARHPLRLMEASGDAGMMAGVAINPATPIEHLRPLLPLQSVLVMTVEPGFAGADFIPGSPERVARARGLCGPTTQIIVDGHIDEQTAPKLAESGADIFVCGTASIFSGRGDYDEMVDEMSAAIAGSIRHA
jgi:ribulose-phosphate 3-epimerase